MNGFQILYLPWEGLSAVLRALSLSGAAGNAAAFLLYVLISLLPAILLGIVLRKEKRGMKGEDVWLLILSAYTFYLLYVFINPVLLTRRLPELLGDGNGAEEALPLAKSVCAGLWLSIGAAWVLTALNRKLGKEEILDEKEFLYRGVRGLLWGVMFFEILGAALSGGEELLSGFGSLQGNAGAAVLDYVALILHLGTKLIPRGFLLAVLVRILKLLGALREADFGGEEMEAARKLSASARATVSASVFCCLLWNGGLFLFAGKLIQLHYSWEISLFPLLTAFASLILVRYLRSAGELKEENRMII